VVLLELHADSFLDEHSREVDSMFKFARNCIDGITIELLRDSTIYAIRRPECALCVTSPDEKGCGHYRLHEQPLECNRLSRVSLSARLLETAGLLKDHGAPEKSDAGHNRCASSHLFAFWRLCLLR
jgi:hypothetical protein